MENVHNYIYPFIIAKGRESQEDNQLFTCLMGSLTKGACSTVTMRPEDYTFRDEFLGVLLLKVILLESLVETKSTTNLLQANLTAGLPAIMSHHGNNVKSFNKEIIEIQKRLSSYGKRPEEILSQLFSTYTSCETEGPFFQYMEQLENAYNNVHMAISGDTHLMKLAETKYEEMVEKSKDTGVG